ncbi:MAG TPA: hypothetical protein VFF69_14480 [Phycisphaerales bacterium]|nr:hypothetical protein [Phycisphaerales bacterium]
MSDERRPLYYTFGNHMHWVDMQWLWGYDVLPGSVRDMLRLCRETGAKGCVNFDGIGYEKMGAECPEALAELREAVQAGTIEPVGCSYGQPYGLFQGGESNVRQFIYGVRAVRRLLGVRPKTFWEEEFYFFPQLPQMLASCGFTGANLFFQWTWHTPEVPKEAASLIMWEGIDGTRIPTLPRNTLNVHQWPEDFDGLLDQGLINELAAPAIVQWLELMPSKDWMCRSEVLLPRLKELFADERFELRPGTCADIIAALTEPEAQARPMLPARRYTMDQVWHGMTLGKNADRHPRRSREVEREILAAESLAALAGIFGRPYASWDVYPTWELDEAWRELLAAQHHDNHECEGLCGFVGHHQMGRAQDAAEEARGRTHVAIEQRVGRPVVQNRLGWARDIVVYQASTGWTTITAPPFGYATSPQTPTWPLEPKITREGALWTMQRGGWEVEVDVERGLLTQVRSPSHPEGVLRQSGPLAALSQTTGGKRWQLPPVTRADWLEGNGELTLDFGEISDPRRGQFSLSICILPDDSGISLTFLNPACNPRPDPGIGAALRMAIEPAFHVASIRADTAYTIGEVSGTGPVSRKYPTGDWMTSPQWFEHLERAVFSASLVDLLGPDGSGLLVLHDASQQWLRTERGVEVVCNAYDPWDESRYDVGFTSLCVRLVPHAPMDDAERARRSLGFSAWEKLSALEPGLDERCEHGPPVGGGDSANAPPVPDTFGALEVTNAPGVLAHAFYRESMKSGEHLPDWAGHRMAGESAGACTHPYVIRLVEWNGEPAEVTLKLPGDVALAAKTNLMGECGDWRVGTAPATVPARLRDTGWLTVEPSTPPDWARGARFRGEEIPWSQVRFAMRPREIATIMADLVMGRKEFRDLDAKREVWAKVHRV